MRTASRILTGGGVALGLGAVTALVAVAGWDINPLEFQGDAPRHFLNGAFYLDLPGMLLRAPDLVEVSQLYYSARPAIAPTIWPPGLYLALAAAFHQFGASPQVARCVVLAFGWLALLVLFALVRSRAGARIAWLAAILMACSPGFIRYANSVMLEVPALAMCLVALAIVDRYARTRSPLALFLILPSAAAAFLTKQHAVFLLPLLVALWARSGEWGLVRRRALQAGLVVGVALLAPWAYVSLTYGFIRVEETLSLGTHSLTSVENWTYYLSALPGLLGWPVAIVALCGVPLGWLVLPKGFRAPLHLWGLSVYLTMSLVSIAVPRYAFSLLPWAAVCAAAALVALADRLPGPSGRRLVPVALAGLLATVTGSAVEAPASPRLQAFRTILDALPEDPDTPVTVLYDGYHDGIFVAMVRAEAPRRPLVVVRGQKVLYAQRIYVRWGLEVFVTSEDEILGVLEDHHSRYVVVEMTSQPDLAVSRTLRHLLRTSSRFRLVARVETGGPTGDLLLYAMSGTPGGLPDQIELAMPILGAGERIAPELDWRVIWPEFLGPRSPPE